MASADFSLRVSTSPFQALGEISPGKNTLLHRTTAGFTPPCLGHKSFAASSPLALLGSASYPILVHRLTVYASRFLPTVGHPSAVALHFVRCGQLTGGLAPPGVRPCRAHQKRGGRSHPFLHRLNSSVLLDNFGNVWISTSVGHNCCTHSRD